jgi:hypothetical protein
MTSPTLSPQVMVSTSSQKGLSVSQSASNQSNPYDNGQNRWPYPNFFPYQMAPLQRLPHVSANQVLQGIQAGEEFLPIVAPQLAHVTPLITVGYAGKDIYSTFRQAYKKTEDLPPAERVKKIAVQMGDVTLFHLLATFLIPLLLAKKAANWVKPTIQNTPYLPKVITQHKYGPFIITAAVLTALAIFLARPVNKAVDSFLEVTYRPLVEKRKREKLLKEQKKLLKQYKELMDQMQKVSTANFPSVLQSVSQFSVNSLSKKNQSDKTAFR